MRAGSYGLEFHDDSPRYLRYDFDTQIHYYCVRRKPFFLGGTKSYLCRVDAPGLTCVMRRMVRYKGYTMLHFFFLKFLT